MITIHDRSSTTRRTGFTLIELLVVIAIISRADRPAVAGRAGRTRGRPPHPVHKQPQADRAGAAQLRGHHRVLPSLEHRGLHQRGVLLQRLQRPRPDPAVHGAGGGVQLDQFLLHPPDGAELDGRGARPDLLPLPERPEHRRPDRVPLRRERPRPLLRLQRRRLVHLECPLDQRHEQRAEQPRRLRPQSEPEDRAVHRRHQPDTLRLRRQGPQPVLPGRRPVLGGQPELADGPSAVPLCRSLDGRRRNTRRSPPATPCRPARVTRPGWTATRRRPA